MTENKEMEEKIIFQKAVVVAGLCYALEQAIDDLNFVLPFEKQIELYAPDEFLCNGDTIKSLDACGNVNNLLRLINAVQPGETDEEEDGN